MEPPPTLKADIDRVLGGLLDHFYREALQLDGTSSSPWGLLLNAMLAFFAEARRTHDKETIQVARILDLLLRARARGDLSVFDPLEKEALSFRMRPIDPGEIFLCGLFLKPRAGFDRHFAVRNLVAGCATLLKNKDTVPGGEEALREVFGAFALFLVGAEFPDLLDKAEAEGRTKKAREEMEAAFTELMETYRRPDEEKVAVIVLGAFGIDAKTARDWIKGAMKDYSSIAIPTIEYHDNRIRIVDGGRPIEFFPPLVGTGKSEPTNE